MKKFVRILALVLVVLMIVPTIVACGEKTDDPAASTTVTTAGGGADDGGETTSTWTPIEKKDWGGEEYLVCGLDSPSGPQFITVEIYAEELNNKVVNDAVYNRNAVLQRDYNFVVKADLLDRENDKNDSIINTALSSGDERWDLMLDVVPFMQTLAQKQMLLDLTTLPYLNFDAPCWDSYANEQLTIANKLYYTTSDFLLTDKHRTYLNIYNRELARFYEMGMLEDLVDSNEWTIEKALELSRTVSVEVDGISGHSDNDAFGVVMDSTNALAAFAFGLGVRSSKVDAEGKLVLCGLENNASDKWGKVLELTADKNIARNCSDDKNWSIANTIFCDGRALITTCFLSSFDTTLSQSMEFEHGYLPMPKWEATQEAYYTVPDVIGYVVFGVPYTTTTPEFSGYGLEALSESSTDTTLAAYYETKCKLHLSYDQRCADMLDFIFDGLTFDVVYNSNIGKMRSDIFVGIYTYGGQNVWTRLYNKKVEGIQLELENIIAIYNGEASAE